MGLLSDAIKIGTKIVPRLIPSGRTAAVVGGVVATGVAADVAFSGGEHTVAPLSSNVGEAVGRGSTAFGTGLAGGALDQLVSQRLPGDDGTGRDGNISSSTAIAIGVVIVAAILVLKK